MILLAPLPEDSFCEGRNKQQRHDGATTEGELLTRAIARFYSQAVPLAKQLWGERLARIPWTTRELKRRKKRSYNNDERAVIGLLAAEGSIASLNYCNMRHNRLILNSVLKKLQHDRKQQVVLAEIVCPARYKFFNNQWQHLPATCQNKCGDGDSPEHMVSCYDLSPLNPDLPMEEKVWRLVRFAKATSKSSPFVPTPLTTIFLEQEADEIPLNSATDATVSAGSPTSSSSLGVSLAGSRDFDEE